jgi:hypothetical protein
VPQGTEKTTDTGIERSKTRRKIQVRKKKTHILHGSRSEAGVPRLWKLATKEWVSSKAARGSTEEAHGKGTGGRISRVTGSDRTDAHQLGRWAGTDGVSAKESSATAVSTRLGGGTWMGAAWSSFHSKTGEV